MDKVSYALGLGIGRQLCDMGAQELNIDDFATAIKDIIAGRQPQIGNSEAQQLVQNFFAEQEKKQRAAAAERFKTTKEEGERYLADNAKKGMLIDGTLFDSSIQRGEPATFPLNGVIAGWTEGLQLMQEGGKYRFFIPYHLGYGEHGAGSSIPPFAALVFDVELLEVL